MTRPLRRMTAAEFDGLRPMLKTLSRERVAAARAVLVEGKTQAEVAEHHGWSSRNSVASCVDAVWRKLETLQASQMAAAKAATLLPPGWEQVTLIAPSQLVAKFRREIAEAARSGVPGKPKKPAKL